MIDLSFLKTSLNTISLTDEERIKFEPIFEALKALIENDAERQKQMSELEFEFEKFVTCVNLRVMEIYQNEARGNRRSYRNTEFILNNDGSIGSVLCPYCRACAKEIEITFGKRIYSCTHCDWKADFGFKEMDQTFTENVRKAPPR